jgi:hypothetical protein
MIQASKQNTNARVVEKLRGHVDTVQITIGGTSYDFNLGMYAADLAHRLHGFNIFAHLDKIMGMLKIDPETGQMAQPAPNDMIPMLSAYADVVWCGMLPFDPELTPEEVKIDLSLSDIAPLSDIVATQIMKLMQGHNKGEVQPKGKKKAPPKTYT